MACVLFLSTLAGCESVPDLHFADDAGEDGALVDAGVDAISNDGSNDGAPGCPNSPPVGANFCCGTTPCRGSFCDTNACTRCGTCGPGDVCCARNSNVMCKNPAGCN